MLIIPCEKCRHSREARPETFSRLTGWKTPSRPSRAASDALTVLSAVFVRNNFWITWFFLGVLFAELVKFIVSMRKTPCP